MCIAYAYIAYAYAMYAYANAMNICYLICASARCQLSMHRQEGPGPEALVVAIALHGQPGSALVENSNFARA